MELCFHDFVGLMLYIELNIVLSPSKYVLPVLVICVIRMRKLCGIMEINEAVWIFNFLSDFSIKASVSWMFDLNF